MPGKYCFAGLIPSEEGLSRKPLHSNAHFAGIIGYLSVNVVPILTAIPIAFSRCGVGNSYVVERCY